MNDYYGEREVAERRAAIIAADDAMMAMYRDAMHPTGWRRVKHVITEAAATFVALVIALALVAALVAAVIYSLHEEATARQSCENIGGTYSSNSEGGGSCDRP